MAARAKRHKQPRQKRTLGRWLWLGVRNLMLGVVMLVSTYFGFCTLCLAAYNIIPPPTTGVQIQRRIESFFEDESYSKRYQPVSRSKMSAHLRHAVVAAEDGRFYEHGGIDWDAVKKAIEDNRRRGRAWRGGSTITQQLVKNLFLTTHSTYVRKAFEVPFTYAAELLLSKERILDLYLNVIEWDRGVYGAEAAAQTYYNTSASKLSRSQAAGMAAVIPNPRQRTPQSSSRYRGIILRRMRNMNW